MTDGFVAKLNAAGSGLVYSTYLGGTTYDAVHGLAVNSGGEVFVTGYTDSTNFPVMGPDPSCVTIYLCQFPDRCRQPRVAAKTRSSPN